MNRHALGLVAAAALVGTVNNCPRYAALWHAGIQRRLGTTQEVLL
jgi:hypothetical protein